MLLRVYSNRFLRNLVKCNNIFLYDIYNCECIKEFSYEVKHNFYISDYFLYLGLYILHIF